MTDDYSESCCAMTASSFLNGLQKEKPTQSFTAIGSISANSHQHHSGDSTCAPGIVAIAFPRRYGSRNYGIEQQCTGNVLEWRWWNRLLPRRRYLNALGNKHFLERESEGTIIIGALLFKIFSCGVKVVGVFLTCKLLRNILLLRQLILSGHRPERRQLKKCNGRKREWDQWCQMSSFAFPSPGYFPHEQTRGDSYCNRNSLKALLRGAKDDVCKTFSTVPGTYKVLSEKPPWESASPRSFLFAIGFLCNSLLSLEAAIPRHVPGNSTLWPHSLHDKGNDS